MLYNFNMISLEAGQTGHKGIGSTTTEFYFHITVFLITWACAPRNTKL